MTLNVLIGILGLLFYFSGLLVWPVCWLLWRKQGRRTRTLRVLFFCELACQVVLVGFFVFSHGLIEHPYGWLVMMIFVNFVFTPLALVAALFCRPPNKAGADPDLIA